MHAFTLRLFRQKGFGRFKFDPSWGLGSFGNVKAKPDHVLDNILDVVGTIFGIMGEMTGLKGTWIINGV